MRELKEATDKEVKEQDHDLYCWIHDTPFKRRTLYTCNCSAKPTYKKEFEKRRDEQQQ